MRRCWNGWAYDFHLPILLHDYGYTPKPAIPTSVTLARNPLTRNQGTNSVQGKHRRGPKATRSIAVPPRMLDTTGGAVELLRDKKRSTSPLKGATTPQQLHTGGNAMKTFEPAGMTSPLSHPPHHVPCPWTRRREITSEFFTVALLG